MQTDLVLQVVSPLPTQPMVTQQAQDDHLQNQIPQEERERERGRYPRASERERSHASKRSRAGMDRELWWAKQVSSPAPFSCSEISVQGAWQWKAPAACISIVPLGQSLARPKSSPGPPRSTRCPPGAQEEEEDGRPVAHCEGCSSPGPSGSPRLPVLDF